MSTSSEEGRSTDGPKPGSIPFFLSYFWQVQDRATWPVYYTNSVNTMIDLNLWQPSEELADDYVAYKHIQEELAALFTQASRAAFRPLRGRARLLVQGREPLRRREAAPRDRARRLRPSPARSTVQDATSISRLPESYVPPVIAILPSMARNEPGLEDAAKASGTSLPRAFEKSIHAAFTVLGLRHKAPRSGERPGAGRAGVGTR